MIKFALANSEGKVLQLKEAKLKAKLPKLLSGSNFVWLHLHGPEAQDLVFLKNNFNLDIAELITCREKHSPKLEQYPNHLFMIMRSFNYRNNKLHSTHLNFFLATNFLISIEANSSEFSNCLQEKYSKNQALFTKGPDFVLYDFFDRIIDQYFEAVDQMYEHMDKLETEIFQNPTQKAMQRLFSLKKDMLHAKRIMIPARELFLILTMEDLPFIKDSNRIYFRELYDHIVHASSSVDLLRDLISTLLDSYVSIISNRLNEIMKVLTIIATIFMPLTFISGIYGMNFLNIPEMHSAWGIQYGYFFALSVMLFVAIVMVIYFKRKQWI